MAWLEKIDGLKDSERTQSLADYKLGPHNRRAAEAVAAGIEQGYGLITLWGPFGVGKTALMMTAVNAIRNQDKTAIYRTTADMLAWLRAGFDQSQRDGEDFSYEKRWQLLTTVRCLALDEMTAFSVTPWAAERFERLIDERWRSHAGSADHLRIQRRRRARGEGAAACLASSRAGCATCGRSGSTLAAGHAQGAQIGRAS